MEHQEDQAKDKPETYPTKFSYTNLVFNTNAITDILGYSILMTHLLFKFNPIAMVGGIILWPIVAIVSLMNLGLIIWTIVKAVRNRNIRQFIKCLPWRNPQFVKGIVATFLFYIGTLLYLRTLDSLLGDAK